MGDGGGHDVVPVKKEEFEPGRGLLECVACESACPSENCGGIYEYRTLLELLSDPEHGEQASFAEMDGPIDPIYFDLNEAHEELAAEFRERNRALK
jgi:hypothetical protein